MVAPYQFVMIVGRFRDSTNDPRVSGQIRLATPSLAKNVLGGQDNLLEAGIAASSSKNTLSFSSDGKTVNRRPSRARVTRSESPRRHAIGYAEHYSRSYRAIICVYDEVAT
jgi:hypothetical protein